MPLFKCLRKCCYISVTNVFFIFMPSQMLIFIEPQRANGKFLLKLCWRERTSCHFPPKPFDKFLISSTMNVTFTATKRNTKSSPKAIMSEWCSLLQHRSAKMDVTSSANTLEETGPLSPTPTAHFYSIVSLSIRGGLSCCTADSHWVVPWKEKICRHNANHIIIFLPSQSDRKNSWRAWIVLRIPFQPLSQTEPRSLSGSDRSRITESYLQLHTT